MFRRHRESLGEKIFAALVASALLLAALLSVAPQLHEELHAAAGQTAHVCAVTMIASGHCQQFSALPIAAPPRQLPLLATVPTVLCALLLPALRSSIREHAPPVCA